MTVKLIQLDNSVITGIECIDITGGGNNTLVMNVRDLMAVHDVDSGLLVTGNAGDKLQLLRDTDAFSGAWSAAGTQLLDGVEYGAWVNSSAPDEVLLVGQAIVVSLV